MAESEASNTVVLSTRECKVSTGVDGKHSMRHIVIPVLFAAIAIFLLVLSKVPEAVTHDFLNLYSASSLARDGRAADLYNPSLLLQREKHILPAVSNLTVFSRPPWYAVILAPLSLLPYGVATFAAWVALQMGLLGVSWYWGVRRFGPKVIEYTCLYIPPMAGIAYGQDCLFPLILLIASYALATKNRNFFSGLVLGLGLFKFHLFGLWPAILLINRRWTMLLGFTCSAAMEFLVSLFVSGTGGLESYIRFLSLPSDALHPAPEKVISMWGILANLHIHRPAVAAACITLCATATVLRSFRLNTEQIFITATAASLFIAPHVYLYDATILLLPIWLMIFSIANKRGCTGSQLFSKPYAFIALLFLPAPFTMIGALSVAFFFTLAILQQSSQSAGPS